MTSSFFLLIGGIVVIVLVLFFILRFRPRPSAPIKESPPIIDDLRWVIDDLRRQKPVTVQKLVEEMGQEKDEFLTRIEVKVKEYIASQGIGCLRIVEKDANGSLQQEWSPDLRDLNYIKRLWAFCRGETIDGHELDSGLTEPVKTLVAEQFNEFYQEHVSFLTIEILRNDAMQTCLRRSISDIKLLRSATQEVRVLAADLILGQIEHVLVQKTSHVAATPVVAAIAKNVALLMVHHFGHALAPMIAKGLAVPAVKQAMLLIVKKYVIAAVSTAVIKALAAKLSIGVGAMTAFIIAPILAVWVTYDFYHFPEHLGKNVASKIRAELDASYMKNNEVITDELYESLLTGLLTVGINTIVDAMISAPQFGTDVERLMAETALGEHTHYAMYAMM